MAAASSGRRPASRFVILAMCCVAFIAPLSSAIVRGSVAKTGSLETGITKTDVKDKGSNYSSILPLNFNFLITANAVVKDLTSMCPRGLLLRVCSGHGECKDGK